MPTAFFFPSRSLFFFEQSFSLCFAPFAACSLRLELAQNRGGTEFVEDSTCHCCCFWALVFCPSSTVLSTILWLFEGTKKYFQSYRNKTHCLIWKETLHHVGICWLLRSRAGLRQNKTNISKVMCECDLRHHLKTSKNENLQESKMLT